jgi:hypothetical protein
MASWIKVPSAGAVARQLPATQRRGQASRGLRISYLMGSMDSLSRGKCLQLLAGMRQQAASFSTPRNGKDVMADFTPTQGQYLAFIHA